MDANANAGLTTHDLIKLKLCEDFPQIYAETITKTLKKYKYNYSQTYHYIADKIKQNTIRTKIKISKKPKQNITYGSELMQIFDSVNPMFECSCCCETKLLLTEFSQCSEGHLICNNCIKIHSENVIYQQIKSNIKCIDCTTNCKGVFTEQILEKILDVRVFAEYKSIKVNEEIKDIEIYNDDICIKMCQHCGACIDVGKQRMQTHPILICMECFKDTCLKCDQISHPGKPCNYSNTNSTTRHKNEELQTINATTMCKNCKRTIFKDGGCNNITCVCGVHCCWICKESNITYNHFGDKCKLYIN